MTHTVGQLRSAALGRESRVLLGRFDLVRMTRHFTDFYQTIANKKHIHCEFESDQDEAPVWTDQVPTADEPSTGYGLAVTKEFIDRLNGEIWCESALGEGSTFAFRLPRFQEEIHGTET